MAAHVQLSEPAVSAKDDKRNVKVESVLRVNGSFFFYWPIVFSQIGNRSKIVYTDNIAWSWRCQQIVDEIKVILKLKAGAQKVVIACQVALCGRFAGKNILTDEDCYDSMKSDTSIELGKSLTFALSETKDMSDENNIALCLSIEVLKVVPLIPTPPCSLAEDIELAIEDNQEFQDVTIMVGSEDSREEIKANKFMLMARSPVFARMFQSNMLETSTNTVEITDIEPDVFEIILSFVYTGSCSLFGLSRIKKVILAADKYELIRLKALGENVLLKYLSEENAAGLLVFASRYCCQQTKDCIIDFVVSEDERFKKIMETEGWKEVKDDGVDLVEEILRRHVDLPPSKRSRNSL